MSKLFNPFNIGTLTVKNRFIHSATYESMLESDGMVNEVLLKRYRQLAKGDIGLIVPGHMYVHPTGKAGLKQTAIYNDSFISGLKKLVSAIHDEEGKVIFQLAHAGRQTRKEVTGLEPIAPFNNGVDPTFGIEPRAMTEEEIQEIIEAFGAAAGRAADAGADGVQIHAAHGYLGSQFLSPFFNQREDKWGGNNENRFRFVKEVFLAIKQNVPSDMPVLIKLNTNDFTPEPGIDPDLAAIYAKWLADLGIDGIELSSGTLSFSPLAMSRKQGIEGEFAPVDNYHLAAAEKIKPVIGNVPLLLVGGVRKLAQMSNIIEEGKADMISMCRPFIREPHLVKRFASGKTNEAGCVSCNNCLLAVRQGLSLKCYVKGVPES